MTAAAGLFQRNVAVTGFGFFLENRATKAPITTGTVTVYITIDNGTQGQVAGTATHKGGGQWVVPLSATEMDGQTINLLPTHPDAQPHHLAIHTDSNVLRRDTVVETNGSVTVQQALCSILATTAGTSASDGTVFSDPSGTSTRVQSTISGKNRTSITLTPSP